jgi:hypothetical protein
MPPLRLDERGFLMRFAATAKFADDKLQMISGVPFL